MAESSEPRIADHVSGGRHAAAEPRVSGPAGGPPLPAGRSDVSARPTRADLDAASSVRTGVTAHGRRGSGGARRRAGRVHRVRPGRRVGAVDWIGGTARIARAHQVGRGATGSRRRVVVVVAVGAILIGMGAFVRIVAPEPTPLSIFVPVPPDSQADSLEPVPTEPVRQGAAQAAGASVTPSPRPSAPAPSAPAPPAPAQLPGRPEPGPTQEATPSPPVARSYEAESACLYGSAEVQSTRDTSGGQIVRWIGNSFSSYVLFDEVTVPEAGRYTLTFHYLSGERRTAAVSINREQSQVVTFPATADDWEDGWYTVGTVSVEVQLFAGENTIWVGNTYHWTPDLDRITLTAR